MERRSGVRFSPSEITRMERLLAERKEKVLDENLCQKLTNQFNRSAGRVGSRALQDTQVQGWFLNKFRESTAKHICSIPTTEEKPLDSQADVLVFEKKPPTSQSDFLVSEKKPPASQSDFLVSETKPQSSQADFLVSETKPPTPEDKVLGIGTCISNNVDGVSLDSPKGARDKVPEGDDLMFEARSAKDFAWYDIATFLAHRRTPAGKVEVRVRFEGFGAEEDEWVNVIEAVRQQSIPMESSECRNIAEGDLVLCFRERNDEALHFDAHIMEIERKQHDIRGCRCVFLVKYDHDECQERVNLRRLARRPKYL